MKYRKYKIDKKSILEEANITTDIKNRLISRIPTKINAENSKFYGGMFDNFILAKLALAGGIGGGYVVYNTLND